MMRFQAAVMIAAYANAVKWNWTDMTGTSEAQLKEAMETLNTALAAAEHATTVVDTAPVSEADLASIHSLKCKAALQKEIVQFAI